MTILMAPISGLWMLERTEVQLDVPLMFPKGSEICLTISSSTQEKLNCITYLGWKVFKIVTEKYSGHLVMRFCMSTPPENNYIVHLIL